MPVPQVLEEIVALVACRRQATARVDVHAGQADCAWPGGEWPLPPEGTAGGCRALRRRSADIVAAGPSGVNKHAIHDYMCVLSAGSGSGPRGGTAAVALGFGCCASEQRGHHCWRSYWCSQAFKIHATISSAFLEFSSSVDLPVVLSLLYCLPSNEDVVCSLRFSLVL